jgi:nucleotide-binding universal stress UspA family protein
MYTGFQQSWIHPKSIAVATDLTDLEYLLPEAKVQAAASGATLWLVHVIPPQAYVSPLSGAYPLVPKERVYREAEEILAKEAARLQKDGFSCEFEVRRWSEAEQIAALIREKKIDRLIIGTSGKGKVGKLLLGSVAEELIRTVEIPVCTIGPHVDLGSTTNKSCILYATSLHHEAETSLQFALAFAAVSKRSLSVLHVVEHGSPHSVEELDARVMMDDLMSKVAVNGVRPNGLLRFGHPASAILNETAALKPELLILGAVPSSNLQTVIRTGVAYEVIAKAPCPVLTLREHSGAACDVYKGSQTAEHEHTGMDHAKA